MTPLSLPLSYAVTPAEFSRWEQLLPADPHGVTGPIAPAVGLRTLATDFWVSRALHDKILATCQRAMSPASRLLVLEMLVEPDANFPKRLDLMMMVWTGGRERTQQEFERLLSNAGFRLVSTKRTVTPIRILEAELA